MRFKKGIIALGITLLFGSTFILSVSSINNFVYHMLVDFILDESVPLISAKDVDVEHYVILDVRTLEEYEVSHLPHAIWLGKESIGFPKIHKQTKIIVYCSLGKRSEIKGEQLIECGYTNVYNLYGGIIEWHNEGMTTFDTSENSTERIHPYSWFWGLWIS